MQVLKKGMYNLITISWFLEMLASIVSIQRSDAVFIVLPFLQIFFFLLQQCKRKGRLTQIQSYLLILPRSKAFPAFYVLPVGEV